MLFLRSRITCVWVALRISPSCILIKIRLPVKDKTSTSENFVPFSTIQNLSPFFTASLSFYNSLYIIKDKWAKIIPERVVIGVCLQSIVKRVRGRVGQSGNDMAVCKAYRADNVQGQNGHD